ncbi:hypothetical protein IPM65_01685 [Candidatus Roizmanbacteria bacterium]|nr:MAG: hypothetical protein IPM65_01685 [Candidatus Roizmanbacteria bacterium]
MQSICIKLLLLGFLISVSLSIPMSTYGAGDVVAQTSQPSQEVIQIEVNGTISKQLTYDKVMYLVGNFTQVKLSGSSAISRNNIALIDLETQSLLPWNPLFNGKIHDIEVYNQYLFLAGEFAEINGEAHPYFVVVDRNTNAVLEPSIEVNAPVYAVERYNNALFVGGAFTSFAGAERSYIASFNLDTSALNAWSPSLNGPVRSIVIQDNLLYVGGEFTEIDGRRQSYLAAFFLPSGEPSAWAPTVSNPVSGMIYRDDSLVVTMQDSEAQEYSEAVIPIADITQTPVQTSPVITLAVSPTAVPEVQGLMVDTSELGFAIPTLSDLLTFAIRIFFVIAGLAALFYMLIGAFAWVTSGGDKDAVTAAREKIQSAIIGLIMMVVVLAIVWTLEQVVFKRRICLGVSCPLTLPSLIEPI